MNNPAQFINDALITADNNQFYKDYGYLIAPNLLPQNDIETLGNETVEIFKGKYGLIDGMQVVNEFESDETILKKYLAIHFPHKISPVIKKILAQKSIVDILKKIVSPNIKCMQSMLFVKGPNKAGQSWHQDERFITTRDRSLTGAWIAIDDATIHNGCLWIIPASHKAGYIMQSIANTNSEYADADILDISAWKENEIISVEVKSGGVVFFNGYLLHSSKRNNTENNFRAALVNHYMSAESMLPWNNGNILNDNNDCRDIVMVAGTDPYEYKRIEDINKPYLRTEKD